MEKAIELRAHHVANLFYNYKTKFRNFDESHEDYTLEFSSSVYKIYKNLLKNKSLEVKIVRGFDEICNLENPSFCNLKITCNNSHQKDVICEEEYGLLPGEKYTVEELIGIGEDYSSSTGYKTPLHRFKDLSVNY